MENGEVEEKFVETSEETVYIVACPHCGAERESETGEFAAFDELSETIDGKKYCQESFIKHMFIVLDKVKEGNKAQYVWQLRQEEVELMEYGKKIKAVRKILE